MTTPIRQLPVDFLYLDLHTCTRCRATDATLQEAIELTRPALAAVGVTVELARTQVADADLARRLAFLSSPTIRVNGEDIAGELVESACDTCRDGCACVGRIDCRDWVYHGERTTEPPVGLIVEALLRAAVGPRVGTPGQNQPAAADLPKNLRRYFSPAAERDSLGANRADETRDSCCDSHDAEGRCRDLEPELCGCQS